MILSYVRLPRLVRRFVGDQAVGNVGGASCSPTCHSNGCALGEWYVISASIAASSPYSASRL